MENFLGDPILLPIKTYAKYELRVQHTFKNATAFCQSSPIVWHLYKCMNTKENESSCCCKSPCLSFSHHNVMPVTDIVTLCNIILRWMHSSLLRELIYIGILWPCYTQQTIMQVISCSRMRLMEHFGPVTSTDKQSVSSSRLMIWLLCCHHWHFSGKFVETERIIRDTKSPTIF